MQQKRSRYKCVQDVKFDQKNGNLTCKIAIVLTNNELVILMLKVLQIKDLHG